MNELVTELALVAAHERAMLGECEALLGSAAAMQVWIVTNNNSFLRIVALLIITVEDNKHLLALFAAFK